MTGRKYINDDSLYSVFHENSKNFTIDPVAKSDMPDDWVEVEYKRYQSASKHQFDAFQPESAFERLVAARRSPASFTGDPIKRDELERLLQSTAGITKRGDTDDDHRRAYPSGGARYPLEVYAVVLRSSGLEPGRYHFDIRDPALSRISTPTDQSLESIVYDKSYPQSAAVAVLFTAKMDRTTRKYGERGYRYALFEAGHAMQNLCLGAQSLGLSCRPYGGFIEDKADELLGVHGDETTLYLGFVGQSSTVPTDVGDDQRTDQATKSDGTNDEDISGEQYE